MIPLPCNHATAAVVAKVERPILRQWVAGGGGLARVDCDRIEGGWQLTLKSGLKVQATVRRAGHHEARMFEDASGWFRWRGWTWTVDPAY